MTTKTKKDVNQIVTDHVISMLEMGIIPWRVSWVKGGIPRNGLSLKPYRGANVPLLSMYSFESNVFVSEKQLTNLGGTLKPDVYPMLCTYWDWKDGLNGSTEKRAVLMYERVVNIAQCEGISFEIPEVEIPEKPLLFCRELIKGLEGIPRIEYGAVSARYDLEADVIFMPSSEEYKSPELFYYDLFQMLIHATGHASRLDRKEVIDMEPVFSRESLIADVGAHYLCFHAGITGILSLPNTGFIYAWLEKFRDDARLFVFAANQAQKAVDWILRGTADETQEEPSEEAVTE